MDLKLEGRRALVTGSTSGIGEAIAKTLAAEGVRVVVHGRRESEAARVARAIADSGGEAVVALGDIGTDDGADRVARAAASGWGGVDILVNNAGVYFEDSWTTPEPSRWSDVYNQNVVSMIRLVRHFIGPMKE